MKVIKIFRGSFLEIVKIHFAKAPTRARFKKKNYIQVKVLKLLDSWRNNTHCFLKPRGKYLGNTFQKYYLGHELQKEFHILYHALSI